MTLPEAVRLLNLSFRTMPTSQREVEFLLALVRAWLIEHGESWVKNNPLLEREWQRRRIMLLRGPTGGLQAEGAASLETAISGCSTVTLLNPG